MGPWRCGAFEKEKGDLGPESPCAGGPVLPQPRVPLRAYTPFFALAPFPGVLLGYHLQYFVAALQQLSHLVHEAAMGFLPGKGEACEVKSSLLIFHIDHLIDVGFADAVFMGSLAPVKPDDGAMLEYINLIRWLGDRFVKRWRDATHSKKSYQTVRTASSLQNLWIAVKNTADAISSHTVLQEDIFNRLCIRVPKRRAIKAFFTEGNFPSWSWIACLMWTSSTAFATVVLAWLERALTPWWSRMTISTLTVINFAGFLLLFYVLALWRPRLRRLSGLLSENHLARSIASHSGRELSRAGKDVEFAIRSREDAVVTLAIKSSVLNRQVVLIGVVGRKSMIICSWNRAAHVATGIAPEQAIGKSLEAVMDVKSVALARRLLQELDDKPRQQQRLQINSVKKKFPVTIKATTTIAHVDGFPIGMFVGTVVDEEQEARMSYFSRVNTYAALAVLRHSGCASSLLETLVASNAWDALKQRTNNTMRSWCLVTLEELLRPLKELPESRFKVQTGEGIPKQFQADCNGIQELLSRVAGWILVEEVEELTLLVACVTCGIEGQLALQLDVTVPGTSTRLLRPQPDTLELISLIGFLTMTSSTCLQFLLPIALRHFDAAGKNNEIQKDNCGERRFFFTFILHEPDVVYWRQFYGMCDETQHRVLSVSSLPALKTALTELFNELTAVILSAASPDFVSMLSYCRDKGQFVAVTREHCDRGNDGTLEVNMDGPPSDVVREGDYVLHTPLSEERWVCFLDYLYDVKKQVCNVVPHAPMELTVVRRIGGGSCSFVDLVQDKLTGGYMACKTVFINHERTLDALVEEVDIMRQCSSPFIVQCIVALHSVWTAEFRMILQFCPASLERHARENEVTLSQLGLYAFQLLSAVQYLHEKGIAHRDIKPANILMMNENHLKLADFGSAQRKPFREGCVHGATARFMAPERLLLLPEEDIGWRETPMDGLFAEDIWSVGLTLLDIVGMYPPVLEKLSAVRDFLDFYMKLRDGGDELPFELPVETSTEPPEKRRAFHDFIKGMLQLQPKNRMRASELLQHVFVRDAAARGDVEDELLLPGPNPWFERVSLMSPHLEYAVCPSQRSFFTASALDGEAENRVLWEDCNSTVN
ncbi:putative map kinase [Trypanosoma conorhini]|uniref:Putative map kinase n=1 Tax=Trypanosoma conorhini TaxID=83891 RepID=A0A422PMK4_9TRYP|nr:putative map kinase [Trypanosoma conorhini]RNF18938.1 putative map kinase [Trypanosoma conorhini]